MIIKTRDQISMEEHGKKYDDLCLSWKMNVDAKYEIQKSDGEDK